MSETNRARQALIFVVCMLLMTDLSAQKFTRYTTDEFLNKARENNGFDLNAYPAMPANFALPLIDSAAAVELAVLQRPGTYGMQYICAVALQVKNSLLRQKLLSMLLMYDSLCGGKKVTKNDYDSKGMSMVYEYPHLLKNAMRKQADKSDTELIKILTQEFEFWAPFAVEYYNTVAKPGFHQLSIGKTEFDPCVLASVNNCTLWTACMYAVTAKEEYGSANGELNEIYKKLVKAFGSKKDPDDRADFVKLGKPDVISLGASSGSLDTMDFEKISYLKVKFDKLRANDNWQVVIYTHQDKAVLLLTHAETLKTGFSKREVDISDLYFLELTAPTVLQASKVSYRERYY